MTLLNAWKRGDAVHLMSDGAEYDGAGRRTARVQKIFIGGPMRFAIASRGISALVPALMLNLFNSVSGYDELLEVIGPLTREALDQASAINPNLQDQPFEMLIAGWSEAQDAPDMALLMNTGPHPFDPLECGDSLCAPGDPQQIAAFKRRGVDPTASSFDPMTDGLKLAQAQRDLAIDLSIGEGTEPLIGGALELVSIGRDEIRSRVLHRWPEDSGGSIGPELNSLAQHVTFSHH